MKKPVNKNLLVMGTLCLSITSINTTRADVIDDTKFNVLAKTIISIATFVKVNLILPDRMLNYLYLNVKVIVKNGPKVSLPT